MEHYLIEAACKPETWNALVKNPQDRIAAFSAVVERMGGKLEGGWLAFGEDDWIVICELPDNVTAAALSMAVSAGGAMKAVKTTPLMSPEESVKAMKRAAEAGYKPPVA